MRSDAFYAATARQIAREFAGLDPGPGIDAPPAPLPSSLPPLSVDEINWQMAPAETIQADGSPLRASLISYRELALAGVHALHGAHKQIDRVEERYHRTLEELKAARASTRDSDSGQPTRSARQHPVSITSHTHRKRLSRLSGVQGVR